MKKHFLIFISAAMILILGLFQGTVQAYSDVSQERLERKAIDYLSSEEVVRGQGDGDFFAPDQLLRRSEWATMMVRYQKQNPSPDQYGLCFPDVLQEWFAPAVCYAKAQGWIKGYASGPSKGEFGPGDPLNVAEIVVLLDRMFSWPSVEGENWYAGQVHYATEANIISNSEDPGRLVTRAEASEMLFRSIAINRFNLVKYDSIIAELLVGSSSESGENPPDSNQNGVPEVLLKEFPAQKAVSALTKGATYVPVLRFQLETTDTVTLHQVSVSRVSAGRSQDIERARLMINGNIVAEGPFMGGDDQVVWTNLSSTFSAGQLLLAEMSIDFVASAIPITSYEFEINAEDILFDRPVNIQGGSINGGTFIMADASAETITISNSSSPIRAPFFDEDDQIISRFDLTGGTRDVIIKRIRLEADKFTNLDKFQNFRLSVGNQEVGRVQEIDGNVLDFIINDYFLENSQNRTFTVRADIGLARKDDSIRLYLRRSSHIHAFDPERGFGLRVINEFGRLEAWCAGSSTAECPAEGLRVRCTSDDVEFGTRECNEEETEKIIITECPDTLAPVCGTLEGESAPQTFNNRCLAEKAGALGITTGPCSSP